MKKYKKMLAERLSNAVSAECIYFEENDNGFSCDYDIPPITPSVFAAIARNIDSCDIDCIYELSSFSGVYEDGNADNRVLQRIYVTAFPTASEFEEYKAFVAEAGKRDHKTLGNELKLFSSSNEIGQGLNLWHPKGAMLRYVIESFGQSAHMLNEYEWVYTPHIGMAELWKTSGHLDFYKESMYNPIVIDDEEYYLKPMNCPFHIHIYNSEGHSYRDLPVKYAEYGTVYRYEFDFNLPDRFNMFYVGSDGQKHTPYMVHRALFGSLERFIALLIEHYKGDFPFWFSPVQFGIVPIKDRHNDYAKKQARILKAQGFRVALNVDNDNMRNKIKKYQLEKIPYILVIGDKELAENTVSVRSRKDGDLGVMNISSLQEYLKPQIEQGKPRCILDD